jgi:hypothetical protein
MTTEKPTDDDALHKRAMERYEAMESHWAEPYEQISADINFLLNVDNAQWDDGRKYEPDKLKLVINRCEAEVDAVVNDMRAMRPAIDYSPVDDGADVDTAEILDGLARNTEQISGASTAYDTAALPQVAGGLGFLRVSLDWVPGTFDQEPRIEAVYDFSSVLIDELSVELDGHDMNDAFVVSHDMRIDDFKAKYPNASEIDFKRDKSGWCTEKTLRIAEYFYKERSQETIHLLADGTVLRDGQKTQYESSDLVGQLGPLQIVQSREDEVTLVKWCKLNGAEILEKTDWLGSYIPIVPVYGKMVMNKGKRHVSGLIKVLRDPQTLLNYWESAHTEVIALQPKAPWVAAEGQLEGYEDMWKDSNVKNYPALIYNPKTYDGQLAPPPMRQSPPMPSMAMVQQTQAALQHIKSVTGKIYDEGQKTLGAESGKAILAKDRKGEVAAFHYIDNQSKSIRMVGIILGELYPKVYSGARIKRILGEDGEHKNAPLNQPVQKPVLKPKGDKFKGIYDLGAGKYDVTVNVGPSFASRRQEFTESMIQLAAAVPQVMATCADIILRNMDFAGAEEAADRIKKTMPPGIADDEQTPEQIALGQATQAIELLKGKLMEMEKALQDKTRAEDQKHKVDLINADLKKQEVDIKAFEASIKAMQAQAATNERLQPQDWARIIQTITGLDERVNDITTAFELLLDGDEGETPQPIN